MPSYIERHLGEDDRLILAAVERKRSIRSQPVKYRVALLKLARQEGRRFKGLDAANEMVQSHRLRRKAGAVLDDICAAVIELEAFDRWKNEDPDIWRLRYQEAA